MDFSFVSLEITNRSQEIRFELETSNPLSRVSSTPDHVLLAKIGDFDSMSARRSKGSDEGETNHFGWELNGT